MPVRLSEQLLAETFDHLRTCGDGRRECQALWVGPWSDPDRISRVVHPCHSASAVGFRLEEAWLTAFWTSLAEAEEGVQVQIHTHPGAAFHSATDDAFPILATPGFLSLVIPRFALGPVGFEKAFLARLDEDHCWREVPLPDYLEIV